MRILCRVFGHKWRTTHTNGWMIPTKQVCGRCGVKKRAVTKHDSCPEPLTYSWIYSDGTVDGPYALGDGVDYDA